MSQIPTNSHVLTRRSTLVRTISFTCCCSGGFNGVSALVPMYHARRGIANNCVYPRPQTFHNSLREIHPMRQFTSLVGSKKSMNHPSLSSSSSFSLLSSSSYSSFEPSDDPPSTHGIPVHPNVDISVRSDLLSDGDRRNNDAEAVFVVTGASRGIGLGVVKALVERTKGTIFACCRNPPSASSPSTSEEGLAWYLISLSSSDRDRIRLVSLDLSNQDTIEAAGEFIRSSKNRVDVLYNIAGVLGDGKSTPGPERSLAMVDRDWLESSFSVNLVGPTMIIKELMPLLVQPRRRRNDDENRQQRPSSVVANLSARVGSISDNNLGGWYSYRASKAALNQVTRTLAHELGRGNTWCISLHPGTTDTDLSVPFQANVAQGKLFPVDFTAGRMIDVVDSLGKEHSGGFYDWGGRSISF